MADTLALDKIDWHSLDRIKFADEEALLEDLLKQVPLSDDLRQATMRRALELVETARARGRIAPPARRRSDERSTSR